MGKNFKFTFIYESIEYPLEFAPNGWDEDGLLGEYSRSTDFFGLIRSFSLPLRFVKDGATILREAFIKYGIEAGVKLRVEKRKQLWDYEVIYLNDIDFSKYDYNGIEVSVTLMDNGLGADLKARQKITYEFPLSASDAVNMVLPGIKFDDRLGWSINPTDGSKLTGRYNYVPATDLITQSSSGFIEGFNVDQTNKNNPDTSDFSNFCFAKNVRSNNVEVKITGKIKGTVAGIKFAGSNASQYIFIEVLNEGEQRGSIVDTVVNVPGPFSFAQQKKYDVEIDATVILEPGQSLYLYSLQSLASDEEIANAIESGELYLNFTSVSDPSNCKGFKAFDMFKKIMRRVSPSFEVNSDLITSNWSNLIFTSGSAIRELPNSRVKISLEEFFSAFKGLEDAAMGVDGGVMRLEKGPYFARPVKILDIGNVNTCNVTVAEEFVANLIETGYKDGNTNDTDGLEEFNSGVQYAIPMTRVVNTLDWVSQVRADQYGIEKLRVNYNIKKQATSDTESDNDSFMIHSNPINEDGNYTPIMGSQMGEVTGLTFPNDAYNLLLSPKFSLIRHGSYLRSILDRLDGRFIEFTSGDKNTELSVTYDGNTYKINQSVPVSNLDGKYFRPYIFTVNAKFPINAMRLVDNNPFGYIEFNFNSIVCKGFILGLTVDLDGNSAQEIKLLATADSNLP